MLAAKNVAHTACSPTSSAAAPSRKSTDSHQRRHDHQHGRRQDPPRPAGVEVAQRDPAGAVGLAQQQAGDQVAGDHEEDVDADEAAVEGADVGVVERHEAHGNSPQPLDVRSKVPLHVAGV